MKIDAPKHGLRVAVRLSFYLTLISLLGLEEITAQQPERVAPGIWKIVYGETDSIRPTDFKQPALEKALQQLPADEAPAWLSEISFTTTGSGPVAELPLDEKERIYGFGLQVNTFEQRGYRREVRTNSWTIGNIGFSHAPLPFYISSKGYGILINTAHYVNFYVGSQHKLSESIGLKKNIDSSAEPGSSPAALYNKNYPSSRKVEIQVKGAKGIELWIVNGPTMMDVIRRYNLYSGGGAIPPLWALGFKYRAKGTFTEDEVANFSAYFREHHIPCDMFGLEPGWQSAAYSCSYAWNKDKFPAPDSLLTLMHNRNYKLNLWEHAYVHPTSPIFDSIVPYSGDYAVWKGAVPDFTLAKTRNIFGGYHNKHFLQKGVEAFKLDECDAAYYNEANAEWSFPDIAHFPSGLNGEQMRQLFGWLYQKTILDEYRKENRRTMLEVRASYLFAAPNSAALYTDMYSHADFVRMIVNSGFSGLNWSPEVRQTNSDSDLVRRLQTSLMSSHMVVNCWFLKNLPWYQYNREKNNKDELLPNRAQLEAYAKQIIDTRMTLVPYLYNAFADYHFNGIPPFRALVLDYPSDTAVWKIDNEYMMGESLLCAPFIDGASTREIYFPEGTWYDFNTNKTYAGGKKYTVTMPLDQLPLFVKAGTILPLAKPVEFITPQTVFQITCKVYGNAGNKTAQLFDDDGYTYNYQQGAFKKLDLSWKNGKGIINGLSKGNKSLYNITSWVAIP